MEKSYEIIVCGKRILLTKEEYDKFKNAKPNKDFLEKCGRVSKMIFRK